MLVAGLLIILAGGLAALVGWILFLREAFRAHVFWGLGCLFFPVVQLVFFIMNIPATWRAVVMQVTGSLAMILGVVLVVGAVAPEGEVSTLDALRAGLSQAVAGEQPDGESAEIPTDRVAVMLSPACPGPCTVTLKMSNVPSNETFQLIPGERRTFGLPVESTITPANTMAHCQWPPLTFTPADAGRTFTLECPQGK